jgi:hypothetical protein
MREVRAFIEQKKQEFAQLPLFQYMQDKSIDPRQRLAWAACLAPFAMNFGDLNKYVLREEPSNSKIQDIINKHTYEDDHHWKWFLDDLEKFGIDRSMKFSDAMKFFWSEETQKTRQVCNQMVAFSYQAEPIIKLVVIEVIEATGTVALPLMAQVSKELQKVSALNYIYFGEHHCKVETGHATGTDNIEQIIESIVLTPAHKAKALEIVEKLFQSFTESIEEMMTFAQTHTFDRPFTKISDIEKPLQLV